MLILVRKTMAWRRARANNQRRNEFGMNGGAVAAETRRFCGASAFLCAFAGKHGWRPRHGSSTPATCLLLQCTVRTVVLRVRVSGLRRKVPGEITWRWAELTRPCFPVRTSRRRGHLAGVTAQSLVLSAHSPCASSCTVGLLMV
jgi:hypothetical protein